MTVSSGLVPKAVDASTRARKMEEIDTSDEIDDNLLVQLKKKRIVKESSWEDVIYDMVHDLEQSSGVYLNHDGILDNIKKSIKRNIEGVMNKCLECCTDIGRTNPRQLCGKTRCSNKYMSYDSDNYFC